jgi:hypothetical protein
VDGNWTRNPCNRAEAASGSYVSSLQGNQGGKTMIVTPDFLDHWKTQLLVDKLGGDESAPLKVIRLWSHCQNRKRHIFADMTSSTLKAVCHFNGDADELETAMLEAGFIRREGGDLVVHEWEQYNGALIANWNNGRKGGRPHRLENPRVSDGIPTGNPSETHQEPIREDKIRSDKNAHAPSENTLIRPSIEEVQTYATTIGLASWKADDWFNEMEGCGWLDFQHRPVAKWQPLLLRVKSKWEADGRPSGPPKAKSSTTSSREARKTVVSL